MKGHTKQRKCGQRCQEHMFSMKPLRSDVSLRQEVSLQFCPKHSPNGGLTETIYPEFNRDGKAHSPAFILGVDKRQNMENDRDMFEDHLRKIREYTDCRRQIFFPKPSRKHKVCNVCRCNYDDYLDVRTFAMQHIRSTSHKKHIAANKFNNELLALCSTVNKQAENRVEIVLDEEEVQSTMDKDRALTLQEHEPRPTKRQRPSNMDWPYLPPTAPTSMNGFDYTYPPMMGWWNFADPMLQSPFMGGYFHPNMPFMCGSSMLPSPYMPVPYPPFVPSHQHPYYPVLGVAGNPIVLDE